MKKLMTFGAVALFALGMASCQTCYDCELEFFGTTTTEELCSGDDVSKDQLETAVSQWEALGGTCTKQ